jgi:hypothetical protein
MVQAFINKIKILVFLNGIFNNSGWTLCFSGQYKPIGIKSYKKMSLSKYDT